MVNEVDKNILSKRRRQNEKSEASFGLFWMVAVCHVQPRGKPDMLLASMTCDWLPSDER
jgi:hypothetical protein